MQNLPANINALVDSIDATSTAISASTGDMPFLRLLKSGEWVYGGDDVDVAEDSLWAVNPNSFCTGFQSWDDDGELLGEETRLVTETPLSRGDLEDVGAPWKPLLGCQMVCVKGTDKGTEVVYKTTSKGGIKAINTLMKRLVARVRDPEHGGKFVPLVQLNADSYKHKTYGRIYTPMLDVTSWTDMETPDPEPTPEPQARRAVASEPEPTAKDEPAQEPPRRRRRSA